MPCTYPISSRFLALAVPSCFVGGINGSVGVRTNRSAEDQGHPTRMPRKIDRKLGKILEGQRWTSEFGCQTYVEYDKGMHKRVSNKTIPVIWKLTDDKHIQRNKLPISRVVEYQLAVRLQVLYSCSFHLSGKCSSLRHKIARLCKPSMHIGLLE